MTKDGKTVDPGISERRATAPLDEHGLAMRWNLEQELVGQFGRAVQETLTHLESSVLVHGVAQ